MTAKHWIFGVAVRVEAGDHVVSLRDLPEVVTSGGDLAEALALAADAIEVAVIGRIDHAMALAVPSRIRAGEHPVALPPRLAAKAAVYALWREASITKVELARRLGRAEIEVRRILDPTHGTKLDQLAEAAAALGGRLLIGFEPAAAAVQAEAAE